MPTLREGKFLNLVFLRAGGQTPGGLPTRTAVTSFVYSRGYQKRMFHPVYNLSSPNAVLETPDTNSAMYSHLLCALLQRDEIRRIGAIYATVVVKALRFLEDNWAGTPTSTEVMIGVVQCICRAIPSTLVYRSGDLSQASCTCAYP